jgi:hypothetical protein
MAQGGHILIDHEVNNYLQRVTRAIKTAFPQKVFLPLALLRNAVVTRIPFFSCTDSVATGTLE